MATEYLYLGRDNTIDLLLKADDVAVDLSSVTKITASFKGTLVSSTDATGGLIRWSGDGFDTGEIRIVAGDQTIAPGDYSVPIIVYDNLNDDGIQWGHVKIEVVADEEAA